MLPLARGGSNEVENLVTACYCCQNAKSDFTLEQIGLADPRLSAQPESPWSGLREMLPGLRNVASASRPREGPVAIHAEWRLSMRTPAGVEDVRPGDFVRTRRPGKASSRSYRVVATDGQQVHLLELWRTKDGLWQAGQTYQHAFHELAGTEVHPFPAPEPGDRAGDDGATG